MNKAREAARSALEKKAKDTVVLELKELAVFTDYFVICSGESTTQVKAIAEHIEAGFMKNGIKPLSIEGSSYARWILMDYGDVVVHVFERETRVYYELEKLWLDAPRIAVEEGDTMHIQKAKPGHRSEKGG